VYGPPEDIQEFIEKMQQKREETPDWMQDPRCPSGRVYGVSGGLLESIMRQQAGSNDIPSPVETPQ